MIQKLIKLIKTLVQPININSKLYKKVYIFQNSVSLGSNINCIILLIFFIYSFSFLRLEQNLKNLSFGPFFVFNDTKKFFFKYLSFKLLFIFFKMRKHCFSIFS